MKAIENGSAWKKQGEGEKLTSKALIREYPLRFGDNYHVKKIEPKKTIADPTILPTGKDHGKGPAQMLQTYVAQALHERQHPRLEPIVRKEYFSDTFNSSDFDHKLVSVEVQTIPLQSAISAQRALVPKNSSSQKKFFVLLAERLKRSDPSIVRLRLSGMNVNDFILAKLCTGLSRNRYVQFVMLHNNKITDQGIETLCTALHFHPVCHTIWLSSNRVTDIGVRFLAEFLNWNHKITELNISNKWPSEIWAKKEYELHPHITYIGADYLARFLRKGSGLTSLSLAEQRLRDDGAILLFDLLEDYPLRSLNLSANMIGDRCCVSLRRILPLNPVLEELILSENQITSKGALDIAYGLSYNSLLHVLDLARNRISDAGLYALYKCLQYNTTITSLVTLGNLQNAYEYQQKQEQQKLQRQQIQQLKLTQRKGETNINTSDATTTSTADQSVERSTVVAIPASVPMNFENNYDAHAEVLAARRNTQSLFDHQLGSVGDGQQPHHRRNSSLMLLQAIDEETEKERKALQSSLQQHDLNGTSSQRIPINGRQLRASLCLPERKASSSPLALPPSDSVVQYNDSALTNSHPFSPNLPSSSQQLSHTIDQQDTLQQPLLDFSSSNGIDRHSTRSRSPQYHRQGQKDDDDDDTVPLRRRAPRQSFAMMLTSPFKRNGDLINEDDDVGGSNAIIVPQVPAQQGGTAPSIAATSTPSSMADPQKSNNANAISSSDRKSSNTSPAKPLNRLVDKKSAENSVKEKESKAIVSSAVNAGTSQISSSVNVLPSPQILVPGVSAHGKRGLTRASTTASQPLLPTHELLLEEEDQPTDDGRVQLRQPMASQYQQEPLPIISIADAIAAAVRRANEADDDTGSVDSGGGDNLSVNSQERNNRSTPQQQSGLNPRRKRAGHKSRRPFEARVRSDDSDDDVKDHPQLTIDALPNTENWVGGDSMDSDDARGQTLDSVLIVQSLGGAEDLVLLRKEHEQRSSLPTRELNPHETKGEAATKENKVEGSKPHRRHQRAVSINPFTLTPQEMKDYFDGKISAAVQSQKASVVSGARENDDDDLSRDHGNRGEDGDSAYDENNDDENSQRSFHSRHSNTYSNASSSQQLQMFPVAANHGHKRRLSQDLGKTLGVPHFQSIGVKPIRASISANADSGQHLLYLKIATADDPPEARPTSLVRIGLDREEERKNLRLFRQQDPEYRAQKAALLALGSEDMDFSSSGGSRKHHALLQQKRRKEAQLRVQNVPDSFWRDWNTRVRTSCVYYILVTICVR